LILLDDIEKFFNKTRSLFKKNKEYHGNKGVWYYWAASNKKYLAVKMLAPLSDKDREKFCNYIEKTIWRNLFNTKSLSEMQDWLDTFTQKDSGVLANKPGIFIKVRQIFNILTFFSTLLALTTAIVYFWNTTLLFPDLRDELNRLKSKVELTDKILKSEFKNISDKPSVSTKIKLSDDCYEPFIFPYQKVRIEDLSQGDQARLRRIAKSLALLHNELKIVIVKYNGTDENLNSERAKNIRAFLINEGVPEFSVIISDEIEKHTLPGVRLRLML